MTFTITYEYTDGDSCSYDEKDVTLAERVAIKQLLDMWRPEEGFDPGMRIIIEPDEEATDGTDETHQPVDRMPALRT